LDRFERVARHLEDSRKTFENDISIRDSRRVDSVARIQQLRETPRQSDQLFSDLLLALRDLGWIQQCAVKSQTDQLSASLQAALVNVGLLRSAGDAVLVNANELDAAIQALAEAEQLIERLSKEDASREQQHIQARLRFQVLTKRMETLDTLAPLVGADVGELHRKRQSLERQISDRTSVLAEAEAAAASLPPDNASRRMMLSRAVREWTDQVRVAG
jgi:hypothetical protein